MRKILVMVFLFLAPFAYSARASGGIFDLNAFIADVSGRATGGLFDLNFTLFSGEPSGRATGGGFDVNLGTLFAPFCGDRVCQAHESCSICATDCGSCPAAPSVGGGGVSADASTGSAAGGGTVGGGGPSGPLEEAKRGSIRVVEAPAEVLVQQGSFESFTVKATNTGNVQLNNFSLFVEGIESAWVETQKDRQSLQPKDSVTFAVKASVPKDAKVKTYPIFIRVTSDGAQSGVEAKLRVTEIQVGEALPSKVVFRDFSVSNAVTNQVGVIRTMLSNPTDKEVLLVVSLNVPSDWLVDERELEVKLAPGEEREVVFHFRAPENAGVEKVSLVVKRKEAGKLIDEEALSKSFFIIVNRPLIAEETALVAAATPLDVVVSAGFFVMLTGLVITFFVTGKKMFLKLK